MDMNTTGRRSSGFPVMSLRRSRSSATPTRGPRAIGGAGQQDAYRDAIEAAGLGIEEIRDNRYRFISEQAQ